MLIPGDYTSYFLSVSWSSIIAYSFIVQTSCRWVDGSIVISLKSFIIFSAEKTASLPYNIERTKNHMLPIYVEETDANTRKFTRIKNIQGDIWVSKLYAACAGHVEMVHCKIHVS